ncbi:PH domain-containing protein [Streptomyces sp. NPDC088801]|uniref:PH domain-containing protein n=1 Tax=Streptomyces sp. NPDC088801 TaxID=3365903 RepID=UPI00381FFE54
MPEAPDMTCRPLISRPGRAFAGFGAVVGVWAFLTVLLPTERWGKWFVPWMTVGLTVVLTAVVLLFWATAQVRADAYGVHSRMMLRHRSVPWSEVADLHIRLQRVRNGEVRRVDLVLRDGRKLRLPLPQTAQYDDPAFDSEVEALRALHRRYGRPESTHLPVVSYRTAGRGRRWPLALCVLLLAGAGLAAWSVPSANAQKRAWEAAEPCAAETPAAVRGECLTTVPAVITRSEPEGGKKPSWLYFADGEQVRRVRVSYEGAQGFAAGDRVEVTFWRGQIRVVADERHVWREHMTPAGDVTVIAAGLGLGAAYPGALLLMRRRGRRLADDEVLPSALPFGGVLVVTAVWLLPLCYLHPTNLFSSRTPITWWAAGSLVTLGLCAWAWRATRIRTPAETGAVQTRPVRGEVFLAAHFLDHTDYNPHGFGTHIVLGDGPPAVVPHDGPGRFAAKPIPVERLTTVHVRRARGDEETISRSWHVAELDDAGTPVRLAAAPADLIRILRELGLPYNLAPTVGREL